jgi:hypothetical protein
MSTPARVRNHPIVSTDYPIASFPDYAIPDAITSCLNYQTPARHFPCL